MVLLQNYFNKRVPLFFYFFVTYVLLHNKSYGFEEEEHDHEELISSLTALGTGVLVFGEMVEGMDRVFQTIDDILDGVDSILDDWLS